MAKTLIVITFEVEGLHNWPDARKMIPEMGFLSEIHRHLFKFKVKKTVAHADRDIEIIQHKRELLDYFKRNYFDTQLNICNFGPKSCEMLAVDLMEAYDLDEVECLEDGENGAVVYK